MKRLAGGELRLTASSTAAFDAILSQRKEIRIEKKHRRLDLCPLFVCGLKLREIRFVIKIYKKRIEEISFHEVKFVNVDQLFVEKRINRWIEIIVKIPIYELNSIIEIRADSRGIIKAKLSYRHTYRLIRIPSDVSSVFYDAWSLSSNKKWEIQWWLYTFV